MQYCGISTDKLLRVNCDIFLSIRLNLLNVFKTILRSTVTDRHDMRSRRHWFELRRRQCAVSLSSAEYWFIQGIDPGLIERLLTGA